MIELRRHGVTNMCPLCRQPRWSVPSLRDEANVLDARPRGMPPANIKTLRGEPVAHKYHHITGTRFPVYHLPCTVNVVKGELDAVAAVTHSVSGMSMLAPLVPASTCTRQRATPARVQSCSRLQELQTALQQELQHCG